MSHWTSANPGNVRACVAATVVGSWFVCAAVWGQTPPPPPPPSAPLSSEILPAPEGNPPTEAKRVLGKILFWDEQLSSDNTMSCGTCHTPGSGGADHRRQNNFGPNQLTGTPESSADDAFGSPGVFGSDWNGKYWNSNEFGFSRQATDRTAPPAIMAAFFNELFWDGRAKGVFVDPQTRTVALNGHAALETQSVSPPMNDLEMAHYGRTWTEAIAKLGAARPLALATTLPADVQDVLSSNPTYPRLFAAAFGDGAITAARIAMAIATYERTLIPDQTPWDAFNAGDIDALDAQQRQGLEVFMGPGANCAACHTPPLFSDRGFHTIGVRPPDEDPGRKNVTLNSADRGAFRTSSLRNVGLRHSFFHNGVRTTLLQVLEFYDNDPSTVRFEDNIDPFVSDIFITPSSKAPLLAFLTTGLTDPRVAAETFPFDKPTIWDDRENDKPVLIGGGTAGTGGVQPRMTAADPPMAGAPMRLGVFDGLANATATLLMGDSALVEGILPDATPLGSVTLGADGSGTFFWAVPATITPGQVKYFQWSVADAGAADSGDFARSEIARLTFFCPRGGCPSTCSQADIGMQGGLPGPDGVFDNSDFVVFIDLFFAGGC